MALTRPTSWNTYFSKNFLTNCGLNVLDSNSVLLLNKQAIQSFSYIGRNSYVCENYPSEEATLVILNWNALPTTTKTYLTTRNNIIKVVYIIGGDGASPKSLYIDGWELSDNKLSMTIKLKGILMSLTSQCSIRFGNADVVLNDVATNISIPINTSNISNYEIKFIPPKITYGEVLQNIAITTCCGFRYSDVNQRIDFLSLPQTYFSYNPSNIYGNARIRLIEEEQNAVVCGAYKRVGTNILRSFIREHNTSPSQATTFYLYENCVDFEAQQTFPTSPSITKPFVVYNDKLIFSRTSQATTSNINAFYVELEDYQGDNVKNICSYLFYDNDAQKSLVQTFVESVYAINKTIEFDCRIDPTIEALDLISIGGIGRVYVEEVEIRYNGGYRGKIKGRLDDSIIPPLLTNLNTAYNNWHFTITNNNDEHVSLFIHTSNGDEEFGLNAHSSITFDANYYPSLDDSFTAYNLGELDTDVYCYFKGSTETSDNIIILEAQE